MVKQSIALRATLLLVVLLALSHAFSTGSTGMARGVSGLRRLAHRNTNSHTNNALSASTRVRARATFLAGHTVDGVPIEGELKPLNDNVLVRVKAAQRQTASGIIIPDNVKERPTEGLVVAVGEGKLHRDTGVRMNMHVAAGEHVVYGKYHGVELSYDDAPHQMIRADDVLFKYSGEGGDALTVEAIECTRSNVLIELPAESDTNAAGLVVGAEKPLHGKVVKTGPGEQAANGSVLPMPVAVGDHVRFRDFAGTKVKFGGREYLVLEASNILAKY